ncbi:gliding motility-associated C-terminal domain-containing protein [Winogradskyella maritima]|uniref:Gliding motility-associated C-terminal domain-containing protein n=1 Tax=Winogradskyella maritima TaxID=1517766 RepID=A0ABV8AK39_9FLAO|nr:gliding motility-associated C-terminal domain-containing protein [Winogradskyella maritima]
MKLQSRLLQNSSLGYLLFFLFSLVAINFGFAQDVSLFNQLNGHYDYVAIGNTMNLQENGLFSDCIIQTESASELNLEENQSIIAAYLYWAGSGNGDFDINLNETALLPNRTFSDSLDDTRVFFAAFADVTEQISTTGNGTYTLSNLDVSAVIPPYCPTGTNFAGWALVVVYEDLSLPLNQINIYDGLQSVPDTLEINLTNLNVFDNEDAKIGFIAWEGDDALAVNEQLTINGNVISNAPLNPANNAFNGTDSFTGQSDLYNMDIDVYNIQNNIAIGDTSATISLTSGQDFVMINSVITVLNSQLPDAKIVIDNINITCGSQDISIDYTVFNTNSTASLHANTPIAFYADTSLVGQTLTQSELPIGGSESGTITLTIPETLSPNFELVAVVDDNGQGMGIVTETNETNNTTMSLVELLIIPEIQNLQDLLACNEGFNTATFNLFDALTDSGLDEANATFYDNLNDLEMASNSILNSQDFQNSSDPQLIFVRLETELCYEIFQFIIETENCPPEIPEGFSPNGDSKNDTFNIRGLYDIFLEHRLFIYNRYGTLIFEGDNDLPWDGTINRGIDNKGNRVPVGTYYFVLNLNDPEYEAISGWVYVNY